MSRLPALSFTGCSTKLDLFLKQLYNVSMKKLFLLPLLLISCQSDPSTNVQDLNLGATIGGQITISPELRSSLERTDILYIMARKDVGPPLAVKKVQDLQFPLSYSLSAEDVMFPGTPFQGEVRIVARIDRDGNAGPAQPGDLEGMKNPVRVGDQKADVLINQRH